MHKKVICVIGLGYIGLPTASLLATRGYKVHGVDVQESVVKDLNLGKIHIVEPDLDVLVKSAVGSGNFVADTKPAVADVFILAVPTPFNDDKSPDLSYLKQASQAIATVLKDGDLVILESTSPVGTTELVKEIISEIRPDLNSVYYAHCPERVIPGKVLLELVENDRVVGGIDADSTNKAVEFYQTFVSGQVLSTTARAAELCKLAENSFRDVNIAYANELSLICDELEVDVWELIKLSNHHPRVDILRPGPGVGGHCIAVDPWFIVSSCPDASALIKTAREINDAKPFWVIDKVKEASNKFKSPVIACLGVSFKADIDDLRESPALFIANKLRQENIGNIIVCEPNINELEGFDLVTLDQVYDRADIILILVDHAEFKQIDMNLCKRKIVIDTKGIVS